MCWQNARRMDKGIKINPWEVIGMFPLDPFHWYFYGKSAICKRIISEYSGVYLKVRHFRLLFINPSELLKHYFNFIFTSKEDKMSFHKVIDFRKYSNTKKKNKLYTELKDFSSQNLLVKFTDCIFSFFAFFPSCLPLPNTQGRTGTFCLVSSQLQLLRRSFSSQGNLVILHWLIKPGSLNKLLKLLHPELAYLIQITG